MAGKKTDSTLIKDCITTAFLMLLEQKEFENITITEITDKAGVSRMSYYRTYASKEDILIQYFNGLFENILAEIKQMEHATTRDFNCKFFGMIKDNSLLIRSLLNTNLHKLILQRFREYILYIAQHVLHLDITDPFIDYKIHYTTGAICLTVIRWVENGLRESPEEMADILERLPFPLS